MNHDNDLIEVNTTELNSKTTINKHGKDQFKPNTTVEEVFHKAIIW